MGIRLKTKLTLGMVFLFVVILAFGILGISFINRLSNGERLILKDNYITLEYCNNMLRALESLPGDTSAVRVFDRNLVLQEANITEPGEGEATHAVRTAFTSLLANPSDTANFGAIRRAIFTIQDLNQIAIIRKDRKAATTASDANLWMTIIVTILTIVAFTFIVNFPGIISEPVKALSEGITAIAAKNYSKRIHLNQKDEFGDLANAFNTMAEKLDEYDHSSLARVMEEKSRIEAIINQMKDGIIGFDAHRRVLFVNTVAENLIGLRESELQGQYAPDIAVHNDLMRTLLQGDGTSSELKIYCDDKESYFSKEPITVRKEDQVIGEVIVLRNITPFHELDEAKTNFIATVSHELKTPISAIKMSARLLRDRRVGVLSPEQNDLLQSITDDAERLLRITGELLNLTQVETGNLQLKLQSTPPGEVVRYALGAVSVQAAEKDIRISYAPSVLPPIHADAEKVSWVLINLLTNAIKYSPEGGVIDITVTASGATSSLPTPASGAADRVLFSVKDFGRGIDEKYLPRIFDRYFRIPGSEKSGTGLGLAISKEFIEAQGGHIWVKSALGEGAEFGFSLPAEKT